MAIWKRHAMAGLEIKQWDLWHDDDITKPSDWTITPVLASYWLDILPACPWCDCEPSPHCFIPGSFNLVTGNFNIISFIICERWEVLLEKVSLMMSITDGRISHRMMSLSVRSLLSKGFNISPIPIKSNGSQISRWFKI